jgi:hypothetical protein
MNNCIECIQGHADIVFKKEKELIAAGYMESDDIRENSLGIGEYMLRSFERNPLMMITWSNPKTCKSSRP